MTWFSFADTSFCFYVSAFYSVISSIYFGCVWQSSEGTEREYLISGKRYNMFFELFQMGSRQAVSFWGYNDLLQLNLNNSFQLSSKLNTKELCSMHVCLGSLVCKKIFSSWNLRRYLFFTLIWTGAVIENSQLRINGIFIWYFTFFSFAIYN